MDKETLFMKYIEEGWSTPRIAKEFGVCKQTVLNWLRKSNIPIRTIFERNMDERNPAWKGGGKGYWRAKGRKVAYANLSHNCNRCISIWKLEIHHKDKNVKNNSLSNLEILCGKCHRIEHLDSTVGPYSYKKGENHLIRMKRAKLSQG